VRHFEGRILTLRLKRGVKMRLFRVKLTPHLTDCNIEHKNCFR